MYYDVFGNKLNTVYDINGNLISDSEVTDIGYTEGRKYPFFDMQLSDAENIATQSILHTRNAKKTIQLTPNKLDGVDWNSISTWQNVTFTCDITTNKKDVGLWIWIDRITKGVYAGNDSDMKSISMEIELNGNWQTRKRYTVGTRGASLKSGMNYYFCNGELVGNKITSILIRLCPTSSLGESIYLDSLEVGFKCNKSHVMFRMDVSPTDFYESVGYNLMKEYNMVGSFQHHISDTSIEIGTESTNVAKYGEESINKHLALMKEGFDFGTYSAVKDIENDVFGSQFDANYDGWKAHADRMFHVNNTVGIYAPTMVHSSAHRTGETYERANADAGFLITSGDTVSPSNAEFVFFDINDYREIMPCFLGNAKTASEQIIVNLLAAIDECAEHSRNIMIGFHQIEEQGVTDINQQNISYEVAEAIFSKCKSYVDKGLIKVCTPSEFVADVESDSNIYQTWLAERSKTIIDR